MPYIDWERRQKLLTNLTNCHMRSPRELNYVITKIIQHYMFANEETYKQYNEIIGVLECVKMELYRRKIAPYEDEKIETNGDVW